MGFSRAIFLIERIGNETAWQRPDDAALGPLGTRLKALFPSFRKTLKTPAEPKTEKELIWPLLETLGWTRRPSAISAAPVSFAPIPQPNHAFRPIAGLESDRTTINDVP